MKNAGSELRTIQSERAMALMFRALKGEALSPKKLAEEYNTSARTISRDIDNLKAYMSEHPELFGLSELTYSSINHSWTLYMDTLLSNGEMLAIAKILIGSRSFSRSEITGLLAKLESGTTASDRTRLRSLLAKELHSYREPGSDCESVIDSLWKLSECIEKHKSISIFYHKMDRTAVDRHILPVSIMFSDGYFYLIAFVSASRSKKGDKPSHDGPDGSIPELPHYFRVDRIISITVHRDTFDIRSIKAFDEGYLRNRSLYMWPGPLRHIKFRFTGPSVQAVLDKLPTAKITGRTVEDGIKTYYIEAETYGDGIMMYLLSQGSWVKVLEPQEMADRMKEEIQKMQSLY